MKPVKTSAETTTTNSKPGNRYASSSPPTLFKTNLSAMFSKMGVVVEVSFFE